MSQNETHCHKWQKLSWQQQPVTFHVYMSEFCIFTAFNIALQVLSLQSQHYRTMMPDMFHQLQELDEKRIKNIKNFMIQSVDIERNVFPIISKCLDGIVKAAEQIDEKEVGDFMYKIPNTLEFF
jgi:hypothetical protein